MTAIYAKFVNLLDEHVADEVFVVAFTAALALLAQTVGLLPVF